MADDETPDEGADEVPDNEAPAVESAYGVPVTDAGGTQVLHPAPDQLIETVTALRDDGYLTLVDVTAVDYLTYVGLRPLPPGVAPGRFEVVVALRDHTRRALVRLRVQVDGDDPRVPTLFDLYPGSEALEREVADLFGIVFTDHPDPSRILMPEDWIGHPLRKDYAVGAIPVQFKGAPSNR